MKTSVKVLGFAAVSVLLASCGSSKVANYLEAFTPEESGLNLVKLTDESTNSIISGNSTKEPALANRAYYKNSSWAYSAEAHFKWCRYALSLSRPMVANWHTSTRLTVRQTSW